MSSRWSPPQRAGAGADRRHRARDVGLSRAPARGDHRAVRSACRAPRRWCGCTTPSANADWLPAAWGHAAHHQAPQSIDDVPAWRLTLFTREDAGADVAADLERARSRPILKRVPAPRGRTIGAPGCASRSKSPARMAGQRHRGRTCNTRCCRPTWPAGMRPRATTGRRHRDRQLPEGRARGRRAGRRCARRQAGVPADVAAVVDGPLPRRATSGTAARAARGRAPLNDQRHQKAGANAVDVADAVMERRMS